VLRKQRAGLLLNRGMLYVAFGGDITKRLEAPGASAGWIFVYDATDLSLQAIWTPTVKGANAGIWKSGRGLADDEDGYVYAVTGAGDFNADLQNFGDSIVKLKLAKAPMGLPRPQQLAVVDYFAPCNQGSLQMSDSDLGSTGPRDYGRLL